MVGYIKLASKPGFPFQILSHSFGENRTKSRTESLGSRLISGHVFDFERNDIYFLPPSTIITMIWRNIATSISTSTAFRFMYEFFQEPNFSFSYCCLEVYFPRKAL